MFSASELEEELEAKFGAFRNTGTLIDFSWIISDISTIYPSNRALLTKGAQAFVVGKMLEEGGELHRAYSRYLIGNESALAEIGEEQADLTAWLLSCWDLDAVGKDLDAEFASNFGFGCHKCKKASCECPAYSITRGQEDLIRTIAQSLREIKSSGIEIAEVDQALQSAEDAKANPTPKAKKSLKQKALSALAALKNLNEGSEAVKEIMGTLGDAAEELGSIIT